MSTPNEVTKSLKKQVSRLYPLRHSHLHPLSLTGSEYEHEKATFRSALSKLSAFIEKYKTMVAASPSSERVIKYMATTNSVALDFAIERKYDTILDRLLLLGHQYQYHHEKFHSTIYNLQIICAELSDEIRTINFSVEFSEDQSTASVQIGSNGNSREHCFAILLDLHPFDSLVSSISVIFAYDVEWAHKSIDEDVKKCIEEGRFADLKSKLAWLLIVERDSDMFPESSDHKLKETVKEYLAKVYDTRYALEGPQIVLYDPLPFLEDPVLSLTATTVSFVALKGPKEHASYCFYLHPPLPIRIEDIPSILRDKRCSSVEEPSCCLSSILEVKQNTHIAVDEFNFEFHHKTSSEMLSKAIEVSHFKISSLDDLKPVLDAFRQQFLWNHLFLSCFRPHLNIPEADLEARMVEVTLFPPNRIILSYLINDYFASLRISVTSSGVAVESNDFATEVLTASMSIPTMIRHILY